MKLYYSKLVNPRVVQKDLFNKIDIFKKGSIKQHM